MLGPTRTSAIHHYKCVLNVAHVMYLLAFILMLCEWNMVFTYHSDFMSLALLVHASACAQLWWIVEQDFVKELPVSDESLVGVAGNQSRGSVRIHIFWTVCWRHLLSFTKCYAFLLRVSKKGRKEAISNCGNWCSVFFSFFFFFFKYI